MLLSMPKAAIKVACNKIFLYVIQYLNIYMYKINYIIYVLFGFWSCAKMQLPTVKIWNLDSYRILFHAVVIFETEHDFLFKSATTYCVSGWNDQEWFRMLIVHMYLVKKSFLFFDDQITFGVFPPGMDGFHIILGQGGSFPAVPVVLALPCWLSQFSWDKYDIP